MTNPSLVLSKGQEAFSAGLFRRERVLMISNPATPSAVMGASVPPESMMLA
ncbi:MAG: hypothetical protein BWY86_00644 [Candidatus Aminicenantes bacterium ADurb.Bin508]|nr:MAG: hypothetical protein BWY86_00644 [Candidatus Aminicenantes bacterium ADurb.Bin508]